MMQWLEVCNPTNQRRILQKPHPDFGMLSTSPERNPEIRKRYCVKSLCKSVPAIPTALSTVLWRDYNNNRLDDKWGTTRRANQGRL